MIETPTARYRALVSSGELKADPIQESAAQKLTALCEALARYSPRNAKKGWMARMGLGTKDDAAPPRGLYIYGGVGRGKSMLMNLCATAFGDYCYKANIAMFTQKRGAAGAANPELVRMRGKRFVFMSEPDEGEPLSTGFMKELTSSEKVTGRDLFKGSKEMVEFDVQAKCHLACNDKPKVNSNDGGTWRRLIVIDFPMKFVSDPHGPHQLPVDESIVQKVVSEEWATCFMSYLIHLYKEGNGWRKITPPQEVMAYTN